MHKKSNSKYIESIRIIFLFDFTADEGYDEPDVVVVQVEPEQTFEGREEVRRKLGDLVLAQEEGCESVAKVEVITIRQEDDLVTEIYLTITPDWRGGRAAVLRGDQPHYPDCLTQPHRTPPRHTGPGLPALHYSQHRLLKTETASNSKYISCF